MTVGREASAAVEYCVLLGLISILVIAGTLVLSTSVRETANNLNKEGLASRGPGRVQREQAAGRKAIDEDDDRVSEPSRTRSPLLWAIALLDAGLILGYVGYRWGRSRGQASKEAGESEPESDTIDPQLRIFGKRQDMLRALLGDSDLLAKNQVAARHLMTHHPLVVSPSTSVEDLKTMMAVHRVHHLLVCEKENQLVGVVSDRDLHTRRGRTARDVMTSDPFTIPPDAPLGPAITSLLNRQISCLPVVENGVLCGVITTIDLALVTQCVLQLWLRLVQHTQDLGVGADPMVINPPKPLPTGGRGRRNVDEILETLLAVKSS